MAFSAPLSLVSPAGQFPQVFDRLPQQPTQGPPVQGLPGGVPMAAFSPGVGFFEGPVSGNPESVTAGISGAGTPSGPTGGPGAPSAPGQGANATPTVGNTQGGLIADIANVVSSVNSQTPAAQFGSQFGINPTISNTAVGIAGAFTGLPLGILNTIGGIAAGKPDVTPETQQGLGKVAGWFDQFLDLDPAAGAMGAPVGPGSASGGVPGAADNAPNIGLTAVTSGQEASDAAAANAAPDVGVSGVGPGSSTSGVAGAADNSPGGDGAGDGDGDSVICTELHRRGFMDDETWEKDQAFGRTVPSDVRAGYLCWALPIVSLMRRSATFTRIVWVVAKPWSRYMAYGDSRLGWLLHGAGWRLCEVLGRDRVGGWDTV